MNKKKWIKRLLITLAVLLCGFAIFDIIVQHRLGQELMELVQQQGNAAIDAPLALLNPFGTGSNGLLLAFQTDRKSEIRYTIHTTSAELPDYTATAQGLGDKQFSRKHCFLLVGLVPGETQEVTLEAIGEWGKVQERATFTIEMPPSSSSYDSQLTYTDGDSAAALSNGLFYATGLGDYYGYTFFFDNSGVLRYEMVLEGFHSDRFLCTDMRLYTCVSSRKIALLTPIGQAIRIYDLGQYELHHDINWGPDGTILALVNDTEQDTVMDVVVELDPETGAVTELVDFSTLMDGYYGAMTHPVPLTGSSLWQAGQAPGVHSTPTLTALIGDPAFWAGTEYESLSYQPQGDFVPQYGQHDVELVEDDSLPEGQYLLRM